MIQVELPFPFSATVAVAETISASDEIHSVQILKDKKEFVKSYISDIFLKKTMET